MKRALWALAVVLVGCEGRVLGPGQGSGSGPGAGEPPGVQPPIVTAPTECTTHAVYGAMAPLCSGCHGATATKPFFVSEAGFTALLVENPNYVRPGHPELSELLRMLRAELGSKPMPPDTVYAARLATDPSLPTFDTLECWIQHLPPTATAGAASAQVTRRLTAEQLMANLKWALGLTTIAPDYALSAPDRVSPGGAAETTGGRFGFPNWEDSTPRDNAVFPVFAQLMIHGSQSWCRNAVRAGNTAFFTTAAPTDRTATAEAKIRTNLANVFERVTGELPDADTLDGLLRLYRLYEPTSTTSAWVATCAAIVRHPLAITQ